MCRQPWWEASRRWPWRVEVEVLKLKMTREFLRPSVKVLDLLLQDVLNEVGTLHEPRRQKFVLATVLGNCNRGLPSWHNKRSQNLKTTLPTRTRNDWFGKPHYSKCIKPDDQKVQSLVLLMLAVATRNPAGRKELEILSSKSRPDISTAQNDSFRQGKQARSHRIAPSHCN